MVVWQVGQLETEKKSLESKVSELRSKVEVRPPSHKHQARMHILLPSVLGMT